MDSRDGMFSVRDQVVIVTGAGRGIGRWLAQGLSREGAIVVAVSRTLSDCERVVEEIVKQDGRALARQVDVRKPQQLTDMMDAIVQEFGHIDVLINNAGATSHRVPALELSVEDYDRTLDTNVKGTYFGCQAAAKVMSKQGGGKIINFASTAALLVRQGVPNSAYAASKAAIVMMTKAFATEWANYNINVNCIAPGRFLVDRNRRLAGPGSSEYEAVIDSIPMGRTGTADDILGSVMFFASQASDYVTGQTLYVDGGRTAI